MRALLILLVGACGFEIAQAPADAPDIPPDIPPDVPIVVTWQVDPASQKACPQNVSEWSDLISAHGLTIDAPSGLWLMQEASGPLQDSIGAVPLASYGGAAEYRQVVAGWQRTAIGTRETAGNGFQNTSSPALPDVSTASMTVLIVHTTDTVPTATRTIMLMGANAGPLLAQLDVTNTSRLKLTVNTGTATGAVDHGGAPSAIVVKLDRSRSEQKIITNRETINSPNAPIGSSRGLTIGGASLMAANSRWLYMAAWYGTNAEMSDAEITALLTAMGW